MKNKNTEKNTSNICEDLIITSRFPPMNDVSGIVLSKRIMEANKKVDTFQIKLNSNVKYDYDFNNLIEKYINKRIYLEKTAIPIALDDIIQFTKEAMVEIEKVDYEYKNITSRSWTIDSHFLALAYKLKHPNVCWTAEFSDPLLYDLNNKVRPSNSVIHNQVFLEKINKMIDTINNNKSIDLKEDLPHINPDDGLYLLGEYLPYVFADKIRFTNHNQREIMLSEFPYNIKNFVMEKSEVKHHPILPKKYYHVKESDYNIDNNFINFGYFGTYVGKRHLEYLFYAFEKLHPKIKKRIRIHFFTSNANFIKKLISDLSISESIIINNQVSLLEFLNLSTKLDILIVNDTPTKKDFKINPYLPSKLADYLGSGSDIWAICEEDSSMDKFKLPYKSYLNDYKSSEDVLHQIIQDKLPDLKDYLNKTNMKHKDYENYFKSRLTSLNNVSEILYKQRLYWLNRSEIEKHDVNKINKKYSDLNKKYDEIKNKTKISDNIIKENEEIHEILKKSFNDLDEKKKIINDKNMEITYYKNNSSILKRIFNDFFTYVYILLKSSDKNQDLEIYSLLKNNPWFNVGYYLSENKDLSRIKWLKLLNPETHYICHGFYEGRKPNRHNKYNIKTKKELLKELTFLK